MNNWYELSGLAYVAIGIAFAIGCVKWSAELADGASGAKLPRWWADVLCAVCVVAWPIVLIASLFLLARDKR